MDKRLGLENRGEEQNTPGIYTLIWYEPPATMRGLESQQADDGATLPSVASMEYTQCGEGSRFCQKRWLYRVHKLGRVR